MAILLLKMSKWLFQFICWLSVSPRKLKVSTRSIATLSILRLGYSTFFIGVWKIIYLDFFTLSDNLLTFNHTLILFNSVLISSFDLTSKVNVFVRVESSAYDIITVCQNNTLPLYIVVIFHCQSDIWHDSRTMGSRRSDQNNRSKFHPIEYTTDYVIIGQWDVGLRVS